MKRIFIAGNGEKRGCEEAAKRASNFLKRKAEVVGVDLNKVIKLPKGKIDLILSLGGDGSFLNLVSQIVTREIPLMGINFGRMGFLTSGIAKDLEELLKTYLDGETEEISRMLLELRLPRRKKKELALNDVVVCSSDIGRVFSLKAMIPDEMLFTMRGDGLILSTPTGSTAHSLSAGGAIVDPRMEGVQLTPMGPQSLGSRPLLIHADRKITVELIHGSREALILADGRHHGVLKEGEAFTVGRSKKKCRMIQPKDYSFFGRLREKLGWTLMPPGQR